jgi:acid phosphatase type 7
VVRPGAWLGRGPFILAVAAVAGAVVAIIVSERAQEPSPSHVPAVPVVMAAGGIACSPDDPSFLDGAGTATACRGRATSDLATAASPTTLLALGGIQYGSGSLAEYQASFDRSWGRLRSILYPVPGREDWEAGEGEADMYFAYFGLAAGQPGKGYYSFDIGSWHMVALNTNIALGPGSTQERWLRADLARNRSQCTLAFLHRPRFSSGANGSGDSLAALWQALYEFRVDVVLAGGDHHYERFKPQTPDGSTDTDHGIREFVVGTGGAWHGSIGRRATNSEVINNDTFGLLRLDLHQAWYDWRFVPEDGKRFTDAGRGACNAKAPPQ